MRPSNKQRSRNKSGGGHNQRRSVGNIINRVFESAGPEGKVRGTPQQIIEKYQALARDAQVSGDRVAAESFLQHSEHYSRMLGEAQRQMAEQREGQERGDGQQQRGDGQPRPDGQQGDRQGADAQQGQPRRDGGRGDDRDQPRGEDYASSGMATIDPGEGDVAVGLIETPESRAPSRSPAEPQRGERRPEERGGESAAERAPEPAAAEVNGTEHAAAGEEPRKAPAKRSRPRRTSRTAEAGGEATAAPAAPVIE